MAETSKKLPVKSGAGSSHDRPEWVPLSDLREETNYRLKTRRSPDLGLGLDLGLDLGLGPDLPDRNGSYELNLSTTKRRKSKDEPNRECFIREHRSGSFQRP